MNLGPLTPPLDAATDARAVYDATVAAGIAEPSEGSLKILRWALMEKLRHGVSKRLFWLDTRGMLSDGPTIGGANRYVLVAAAGNDIYMITHAYKMHKHQNR